MLSSDHSPTPNTTKIEEMGTKRVDFERGLTRVSSHARYHGHANPKADEIWLAWRIGRWVVNLRAKFRAGRLTDDQVAQAEAIGVRFTPPYRDPKPKPPTRAERKERGYLTRLGWIEPFFEKFGHINVDQLHGSDEWPGAGRWIARIRGLYRQCTLPQTVVAAAETMNIDWHPTPGPRTHRHVPIEGKEPPECVNTTASGDHQR